MTSGARSSTLDENRYLNCIRCGLCQSVCPPYREHLSETASPRGRVALARKGLEGELEISPTLMEQMYACFACMACNQICPVGIQPADLAVEMRQVQEQIHPKGWKKRLFSGVIARPERMELATLSLRLYEAIGLRRLAYTMGMRRLMPERLRDLEAMLPHLPQRPLRRVLPELVEPHGTSRYRVGFFLGCAQSLLFANESASVVSVLSRNGCSVITPQETVCCGMPAKGYGRQDLEIKQAFHNIALFEQAKVDLIVTDCATCGATLKEYAPLLVNEPGWAERAAQFSRKVRDVSELLMEMPVEKPAGRLEARVTYHDPCHLGRAQGIWRQPRALLEMIDGLELVELPEADWCCGSAGSQLITHYDTSRRVLERKMKHIEETQAQYVASGCPGCQMQLNAGVRRRGLAVEVVHPVELLERAYRGEGKHAG
jgi:glycolate oxidase iron-sulfur subunit